MLSRRALLAGGVSCLTTPSILARAQNSSDSAGAGPTILRLARRDIEVNGKTASVYGIRQPNGTFGLTTEVGKRFLVRVENGIGEPSLIHWHGLTPPWRQDGVPGISGPPIPAGGSADYDFPLRFGGTFWMHSHQGLQEQLLMATPLSTGGGKMMMSSMKMSKGDAAAAPDLNDVKYDAFLANFRTLADPETVKVEPGGRVLLRLINSSAMSAYHIDLGELDGELIAVDGFAVAPIQGRSFPIAVAQRLDIRVSLPSGSGAYPVLAQLEGERNRTGIVLAAGNGPVARIADQAEAPSPALTLDLERRLSAVEPLKPHKADRIYTINLTGEMAGYVWSLNNVAWNKDVPPLPLATGERVELVMMNQTPMPHPMHLHGHEFQVVEIDGARFSGAVRDTALVPPGRRAVVAFDANNPGWWAFHCHLLYHLDAGMFTTFRYE